MGLFDTICCRADVPGAMLLGSGEYQTTDLGRRMERFTIVEDGRLIHHRTHRFRFQQVPEFDIVVPLHRDITLSGETLDRRFGWFVMRFTDGRLEWIRRREDLSEDHQEYLWAGN